MNNNRPKRDISSLEETTTADVWEVAAIVEAVERKGLCQKQDFTTSSLGFAARMPMSAFLRRPSLDRISSLRLKTRSLG